MDSMHEITLTQTEGLYLEHDLMVADDELDLSIEPDPSLITDSDLNLRTESDLNLRTDSDLDLRTNSDLNLRTDCDLNPEITRVVNNAVGSNNRQKKKVRTREKIAKLVAEGTKNYPAYLKLVHTGDSDFSDSDHEMERVVKARKDEQRAKNEERAQQIREQYGNWESKWEVTTSCRSKKERLCVDIKKTDQWIKTPDTPGEEKKDSTKVTPTGENIEGE